MFPACAKAVQNKTHQGGESFLLFSNKEILREEHELYLCAKIRQPGRRRTGKELNWTNHIANLNLQSVQNKMASLFWKLKSRKFLFKEWTVMTGPWRLWTMKVGVKLFLSSSFFSTEKRSEGKICFWPTTMTNHNHRLAYHRLLSCNLLTVSPYCLSLNL